MICFRDQSYCAESSECANTDCNRRWTEELAYQAKRWWGGEGAPVAFMPMRETCGKFIKPESEMNDRELMELAAMAAGNSVRTDLTYEAGIVINDGVIWNPLTNDGDALRLAVKLLFEIDFGLGSIAIRHSTGIKIIEAYNDDPYAATRRAIVLAAAEIGKEMK